MRCRRASGVSSTGGSSGGPIALPGGRRLGGWVSLFLRGRPLAWRVRLVLWAALAAAGGLVLGWVGIAPGLTAAIAAELAFSYRWSASAWLRSRRHEGPDPGDPAGVREPRRPRPSGGAGAVELPGDPVPPGLS